MEQCRVIHGASSRAIESGSTIATYLLPPLHFPRQRGRAQKIQPPLERRRIAFRARIKEGNSSSELTTLIAWRRRREARGARRRARVSANWRAGVRVDGQVDGWWVKARERRCTSRFLSPTPSRGGGGDFNAENLGGETE